ncbi:MAG: hypothetical protein M3O46_16275 [Myxococcota bacterium]|nr:hypothetical protein [Myxococcota bacterium]
MRTKGRSPGITASSWIALRRITALVPCALLQCGGNDPAATEQTSQETFPATAVGWAHIGPNGVTQPDGSAWSGTTTDVEAIPGTNIVRVATLGSGILESQSGGAWTPLTDNIVPVNRPPMPAEGLAANTLATRPSDPTTLVFGTASENQHNQSHGGLSVSSGIWRGTSVGAGKVATWTQVVPANLTGDVFKIRWSSPTTVQAATSTGYWVSKKQGAAGSWNRVVSAPYSDLAISPSDPTTTFLAHDGVGLESITTGGSPQLLIANPNAGRSVIAVAPRTAIYYMPGSTATHLPDGLWTVSGNPKLSGSVQRFANCSPAQISAGPPWPCFPNSGFGTVEWTIALAMNPANPKQILASNAPQVPVPNVIVSQDGGFSWNTVSGSIHADIHGIAWDDRGRAMAVGDGGFFYSQDGGRSWRGDQNNSRMVSTTDFDVGVAQSNFYGTAWDTGNFSSIGIGQWKQGLGGDGSYVTADPNIQGIAYASFGACRFRTTTAGLTWGPMGPETNSCNPSGQKSRVASDHGATPILYTPSETFVYSDDANQGGSWNLYDTLAETIRDIAVGKQQSNGFGDLVYALGVSSRLYVEAQGGQGFPFTDITPSLGTVGSVITHPTNSLAAYALTTNPTRVWGTSDSEACINFVTLLGGSSCWSDLTGNLPVTLSPLDLAIDPKTGALYLATDAGVYKTTNNGSTWVRWITNMPASGSQSVWRLRTVDRRSTGGIFSVYAGVWGSGLWVRDGAE